MIAGQLEKDYISLIGERIDESVTARDAARQAGRRPYIAGQAEQRGRPSMRVVICGAGVIGACTAYLLSPRGIGVVVVERTGVACAASGKAGGFIALDWCDGSPLGPLARRSFALHAELAARFPGAWDYRRLDTLSVAASPRRRLGGQRADWLAEGAVLRGRLGTPETTAQAHPAKFSAPRWRAPPVEEGSTQRVVG